MNVRAILFVAFGLCGACQSPGDAPWPLDYETAWREARTPCTISHDHELRYVRVFANELAYDPYTRFEGVYPPGAMLLKAEYDDDQCTVLESYVLMERLQPGTTPADEHDWTWRRFDPDLSEVDDPRSIPLTCVDCHAYHCASPPFGLDYTCPEGGIEPAPP